MKILVTGISGRIGANLAKALSDAGHEVRGLVWANDRRLEATVALTNRPRRGQPQKTS